MFEYLDFQKFGKCNNNNNCDKIINPMDLSTIKEKITSNEYEWIEECSIDIEWICHNYCVFFEGGQRKSF